MPNGGSDCCGECWFNLMNHPENAKDVNFDEIKTKKVITRIFLRFRRQLMLLVPAYCMIRGFVTWNPYYTYCANHQYYSPEQIGLEQIGIPIGPVFIDNERKIWKTSPNNKQVRRTLLELVARIDPKLSEERLTTHRDDIVMWQLGEFREKRAIDDLKRIVQILSQAKSTDADASIYEQDRVFTLKLVTEALEKIEGRRPKSKKRFP